MNPGIMFITTQAGRKRLEVERCAEALYKAALNSKAVGDLPKLEAAILNARKVCGQLVVYIPCQIMHFLCCEKCLCAVGTVGVL